MSVKSLSEESVIRKFRNTAADGKSYLTQFYNLDAIISGLGYRFPLSQNDKGAISEAHCTSDGTPYLLTEENLFSLRG